MKALIALLLFLTIIPVSIITMIWGWGLTPENWGWIAFGYVWMIIPTLVSTMVD